LKKLNKIEVANMILRILSWLLLVTVLAGCQTNSASNSITDTGKNLGEKNWREITAIESRFQLKISPGGIRKWQINELSGRRQERVNTKFGNVFYEYYHGLGGFRDFGDVADYQRMVVNRSRLEIEVSNGRKKRIKNGIEYRTRLTSEKQKCSVIEVLLNEPGSNEWVSRSEQFYQTHVSVSSCSGKHEFDAIEAANQRLYNALILDGGPKNRAGV
jgi:hypothetical protein